MGETSMPEGQKFPQPRPPESLTVRARSGTYGNVALRTHLPPGFFIARCSHCRLLTGTLPGQRYEPALVAG